MLDTFQIFKIPYLSRKRGQSQKIWKPYTGPAAELLTWSKRKLLKAEDEGEEKQLIDLLRRR